MSQPVVVNPCAGHGVDMMNSALTDGGVHGSDAFCYLEEHWKLRIVADVLPSNSTAWERLDSVANRCSVRVLLAPWNRRSQPNRLRLLHGWRFADRSCILRIKDPSHLEVSGPQGISAVLMHDSDSALRHLLRYLDIPLFDALAVSYLSHHGQLPTLSAEDLAYALISNSRDFRMAAIASLTRRRS